MPKPKLGTHACRSATLTGRDHHTAAIVVHVEPYPLSVLGEVEALRDCRTTYQVAHYGLAARNSSMIRTRPAGSVMVLAEHRCGEPLPRTWIAEPKPKPRPVNLDKIGF
jgi:hypothetical protein